MYSRSIPFLLIIAIACSKDDRVKPVEPKGERQVGIHITQAELNTYDTEFLRVKSIGLDVVPLTLPWNFVETSSGFDFSYLKIANDYYPAHGVKLSLNISPIYAVNRALPADLDGKDFDDPVVITRFKVLLDSVYRKTPDADINNFIVGLEVDNYLNSHPDEWDNYKVFYDSAIAYIKKLWGNTMPVGVETTWGYTVYDAKDNILNLNEHSDMMVLSYYPILADFTVKPPIQVHDDVEEVITLYPNIPVFIVECGYQTSDVCNSSDEMQRQFISEMFKLWDNHAEKINFMGFLWLTDLSDAYVDQLVIDYGLSGFPYLDEFRGYLQTTGLRTYSGMGNDKPGFQQLEKELKVRGW